MGQIPELHQDHVSLVTTVQEVPKVLFSMWSWKGIIPLQELSSQSRVLLAASSL